MRQPTIYDNKTHYWDEIANADPASVLQKLVNDPSFWANDPKWNQKGVMGGLDNYIRSANTPPKVTDQRKTKPVGTIQVKTLKPLPWQSPMLPYYDAFRQLMDGWDDKIPVRAEKVKPVYPEIEAMRELLAVLGIDNPITK